MNKIETIEKKRIKEDSMYTPNGFVIRDDFLQLTLQNHSFLMVYAILKQEYQLCEIYIYTVHGFYWCTIAEKCSDQ